MFPVGDEGCDQTRPHKAAFMASPGCRPGLCSGPQSTLFRAGLRGSESSPGPSHAAPLRVRGILLTEHLLGTRQVPGQRGYKDMVVSRNRNSRSPPRTFSLDKKTNTFITVPVPEKSHESPILTETLRAQPRERMLGDSPAPGQMKKEQRLCRAVTGAQSHLRNRNQDGGLRAAHAQDGAPCRLGTDRAPGGCVGGQLGQHSQGSWLLLRPWDSGTREMVSLARHVTGHR